MAATVASVLGVACGPAAPTVERFELSDSAGVAVAWSLDPRFSETIRVDPSSAAIVSAEFASPDYFLYGAIYAEILTDGGFVVGNRGSRELFFFSPSAEFRGVVGGQGEGPGEFQRLFDLYRCGDDRLVVEELSRISLIDGGEMRFEETVPIVGHLAVARGNVAGVDDDCSAVLMMDSPDRLSELASTQQGVFDLPVTLYWAALSDGARDTVGTFGGSEAVLVEIDGRRLPVRAPYGREGSWVVGPEGVVIGLAEGPEFRVLGQDGTVQRIVRWRAPDLTVTDEAWRFFEESQAARLRDNPEQARFLPPAAAFDRPSHKPAYSTLLTDSEGRTWVRSYGLYGASGPEPSSTWWVFAPNGEWLAEVEAPEGLEVLAIGNDRLVGLVRDELDLEQIQVHRFTLE